MDELYNAAAVERAAQAEWTARGMFRAREDATREKFYACSMLPYPSGKLHMGHVRNYTINDVMYRSLRMQGRNVLMPMGWDAFGLPAENAAMEKNIAPAQWTRANIADMKAQMQPLGLAFDWSREVATCDPAYYRWNQWFFLKMLEKGIAYRKTQTVNWDPIDQTVLANEQVIDGRGWRSGAIVEKREIPGYYLAITQYAEELLDYTQHKLEGWPHQVRTMQENWIGRSYGVNFGFPYEIAGAVTDLPAKGLLRVFTTRADTIMGVTFVAVAAEHPLATHLGRANPKLAAFIEECKQGGVAEAEAAAMEKKGMSTGFHVTHPLTNARVEVWVGNYVLMGYGEGAVMGVPAHDERDFAFAKRYALPIRQVIRHLQPGFAFDTDQWQAWYGEKDVGVCVNSGKYDGLAYEAAADAVAADLNAKGVGEKQVRWRLRDWGISRQRYWGTPIPIIHCEGCGAVPVPEKDLPVVLPEDLIPDGTGNPLNKDERFLACSCPKCGKPARRETDTMDTFVDSSWYYMRYCCPDADRMVDERVDYWMPMDQYIGGIEHAVLHLLYARFWTKVMRDMGLVKFDEPFTRLFTQGMLLAECYYREEANGRRRWYYPAEIDVHHDEKGRPTGAVALSDGQPVIFGGTEKMSKSKNNVVEPRDIIERFGADTARAYVMFAGPPAESAVWSDSGAAGVQRFLRKLWATCHAAAARATAAGQGEQRFARVDQAGLTPKQALVRRSVHMSLKQALHDYTRVQYNTVVSACMKMLNSIDSADAQGSTPLVFESFGILLRTLYPIAPHVTHALWAELGFITQYGDILDAPWPVVDETALRQEEVEVVVQVNGKLRGRIVLPVDADEALARETALADVNVQKFVGATPVRKVVFVRGKLVNIVV
ncbi:MAG TPA: leucine--tRNA ligase [Steroidobacteraceae bacterium]|nr:leucine--tRNA ligase [Steroidobacteraceae bacterium]